MTRAFMCALLFTAAPLAAQESGSLVGTWRVNFPVMMRNEGGVVTAVNGDGTLTITQSGDSLIGSLETDPIPDTPPRGVVQLGGKAKGNEVTLVSRGRATLNMNGNEQQVPVITTWAVKATADSLSGTVDRQLVGMSMPAAGPQPIKGSRKKG